MHHTQIKCKYTMSIYISSGGALIPTPCTIAGAPKQHAHTQQPVTAPTTLFSFSKTLLLHMSSQHPSLHHGRKPKLPAAKHWRLQFCHTTPCLAFPTLPPHFTNSVYYIIYLNILYTSTSATINMVLKLISAFHFQQHRQCFTLFFAMLKGAVIRFGLCLQTLRPTAVVFCQKVTKACAKPTICLPCHNAAICTATDHCNTLYLFFDHGGIATVYNSSSA